MWTPNIFMIFVFSQAVAISIIVVILKKILDRNLIGLAIEQLEAGRLNPEGLNGKNFDPPNFKLVVITHKKISDADRERIAKAVTKNIAHGIIPDFQIDEKIRGGMIIKAGTHIADYSLVDRLRRAK